MLVSDLLVEMLRQFGVKRVFGIPGDAINDLMESIRKQDEIEFIQVKHEEAGALAASIAAKLTGNLTVCLGTSGPGAIHLLNGLYDAKLDHAPVLAITGQVDSNYLGTNYHQEVDLQRLFSDVAAYSQTIFDKNQLPDVALEACRAALAHRTVSHLSLPSNVAEQSIKIDQSDISKVALPGVISPAKVDCNQAINLINESSKPVILAGIGASHSVEELIRFSNTISAPIVRTLRAKDIIDEDQPNCIGGIGLLGGKPAVKAFDQCDLLIMIGTDFPYKEFYPDQAKVIQIDNVPTQIGKRHPVDVGMVGTAKSVLHDLNEALSNYDGSTEAVDFLKSMQEEHTNWMKKQYKDEQSDDSPIKPQALMARIGELAPDDAIYVSDTGTVTAWSARHLRVKASQRYTLSSALGTMGVALPGAIGAQLAYPNNNVIALAGDGGFAMMMADFITAVRYKLPITVIIFNNGELGFIALEQQAKGLPPFGIDIHNSDFAAYAKACGADGVHVKTIEDFDAAFELSKSSKSPFVIDVAVDPNELVMPPKIELGAGINFAKAKIKEFFLKQ